VMASMAAGNPFLAAAFARPNPVVIVDSPVGVRGVDFVGIDDRAGFRMLAEHLSGLGHSRIGVITVRRGEDEAPASSLWSLADSIRTGRTPHAVRQLRLSGLRDVVGEQAAESSVRVAERTFCSREEGALGAADLLDTVDGLTALMCTADIMALGALDELTRRGLRAGRDVAVTGFDDIPAAAPAGLTTVRQPLELKGRAAVESLLDDRPRSRAKRTILPISLVARDSSQG
jgi:DNA-binding LacI/PurR family transcriptional regulator